MNLISKDEKTWVLHLTTRDLLLAVAEFAERRLELASDVVEGNIRLFGGFASVELPGPVVLRTDMEPVQRRLMGELTDGYTGSPCSGEKVHSPSQNGKATGLAHSG